MTLFQAIILGIVQGITEFLPVSSHAHLILFPWFFKWPEPGLAFDVFLHSGTLIATLVYFFRDWWGILRAGLQSIVERKIGFDRDRRLFWAIVLGTIPAALAGLFLHDFVEAHRSPLLIAVALASVGFLIYWIDGKYTALKSLEEMSISDALWIGLGQAFALIPGVSRSGSTMAVARLRGVNRETSARFSFLLSLPITGAAFLFEFRKFGQGQGDLVHLPTAYLVAGFVSSLLMGLFSIHFLLQYLRNADFRIFAWYRLVLAIVIVVLSIVFKY